MFGVVGRRECLNAIALGTNPIQMSHFGAAWHLVRFENAHLIKEPHVTELVELLMTATVHTSDTCTVAVISNSTTLSQLP